MTEDHGEALLALHRLVQRNVLSMDEARSAARLITGDPAVEFPPKPPPPRAPAPAPSSPPSPESPAAPPSPPPAADASSPP